MLELKDRNKRQRIDEFKLLMENERLHEINEYSHEYEQKLTTALNSCEERKKYYEMSSKYWIHEHNRLHADFELQKNLINFKTTTIERLNKRVTKMEEFITSHGLVFDPKPNIPESMSFLSLESA